MCRGWVAFGGLFCGHRLIFLRMPVSVHGFPWMGFIWAPEMIHCVAPICVVQKVKKMKHVPWNVAGPRPDAAGSVRLWAHVAGRGRRAPGLRFASPHLGSRRRARAPGIASGPASSADLHVL